MQTDNRTSLYVPPGTARISLMNKVRARSVPVQRRDHSNSIEVVNVGINVRRIGHKRIWRSSLAMRLATSMIVPTN